MGNASSSAALGAKSTAVDVLNHFGQGKAENFLAGNLAVVTGGNSGIGLETCKVRNASMN